MQNRNGYFVLSDQSCWKAIGFSKRWRTLREWWHSIELVPQNYECIPNDWCLGAEIEVYSKYPNLSVYEENAANYDELKQCTHLLINKRTCQVLFAVALESAECMMQIYNESYLDGYNNGVSDEAAKNCKNSSDTYKNCYNEGHKEGYQLGYKDGYQDGAGKTRS